MEVEQSVSARVRALRGAKRQIDPWRPIAFLEERERTSSGGSVPCVTVFLAGAECPFSCRFCDLWRNTLDVATPRGALTAQLRGVLDEVGRVTADTVLKLYNASNFFDPRAVPEADLAPLAALAAPFARVVVECHPRLVGSRAAAFADLLDGRLEVAVGLETVHPEILPRLNKEMTLRDFDQAAEQLTRAGIDFRVFVLIGLPWLAGDEAADWAVVSTAYALENGARVVSLIPVRGGNGELDRLADEGVFRPPRLAEIEAVFERALCLGGKRSDATVQLDLWDLDRFAACAVCRPRRLARLERMNASGAGEPQRACEACGDGAN